MPVPSLVDVRQPEASERKCESDRARASKPEGRGTSRAQKSLEAHAKAHWAFSVTQLCAASGAAVADDEPAQRSASNGVESEREASTQRGAQVKIEHKSELALCRNFISKDLSYILYPYRQLFLI